MVLAVIAWLSWQSPQPAPIPPHAQAELPPSSSETLESANISLGHQVKSPLQSNQQSRKQLWRVVTRRVISKEGITALQQRLAAMHLEPLTIQRREDLTMHAFDDAELFHSSKQAHTAARFWQAHDIETTVIKTGENVYLVGLGRFFQAKYAESMQKKLDRTGRKYRHQQRTVPIPVKRFTFPPTDKTTAEALWKQLNATGIIMPVLIPENTFQKIYGHNIEQPALKKMPSESGINSTTHESPTHGQHTTQRLEKPFL